MAQKFNHAGKACSEAGLKFLYHVHGYEFDPLEGKTGIEWLMETFDPRYVSLETDVYWVEWAGVDSVEFMKRYGSRTPYIHFKDMKDRVTHKDVEVGDGVIDMYAIARIGRSNAAEWYIVEQEQFDRPSLESAQISLNNMKRIVREIEAEAL